MKGWNYVQTQIGGIRLMDHLIIAEKVLGRRISGTECVHHIDGNGRNNANNNLVICPNEEYHKLLHFRQEALEQSGDAGNKKCKYCKQYDNQDNMKSYSRADAKSRRYYHPECHREHMAQTRSRLKQQKEA